MDVIKFELKTETGQHILMGVSLADVFIDDYLVAFKAFLIACGFSASTIEEIQMMENARFIIGREQQENNI